MTEEKRVDLKEEVQNEQDETDDVVITLETDDGNGNKDGFITEVKEIRENVDTIHSNVEEIKKKHSAILDSPHKSEKLKQELEDLMADIKNRANKIRVKLKVTEQEKPINETDDLRVRIRLHSALTREFVEVMTDYNSTQTDYIEQYRELIRSQREKPDDEVEETLENGNPLIRNQKVEINTQRAKQTLVDVETRHEDIVKLENSIRELHDMLIDVYVLVEHQGELIDRIEYNAEQASVYVETAARELRRARRDQMKTRLRKIILIICLAILCIVLISTIGSYLGL